MSDVRNHPRYLGGSFGSFNDNLVSVDGMGSNVLGGRLAGVLENGQRGAVIADDLGVRGSGTSITTHRFESNFDTIRLALLFGDQVDFPSFDAFSIGGIPAVCENLACSRSSRVVVNGPVLYEHVAYSPFYAWAMLESREPGAWTLWREPSFDPLPPDVQAPLAAARLKLQDAILVPGHEVPFEEIINFRERNARQMRRLREHIDRIAIGLAKAEPNDPITRVELDAFEEALGSYLEEARKPNWRKALAQIEVNVALPSAVFVGGLGAMLSGNYTLSALVASAAGPLMSMITVSHNRGLKAGASTGSPFEYVVAIDRDL